MSTAAADLRDQGVAARTWQDMNPSGRILIDAITDEIDRADVVVAEISTMNKNVLFEAGYALARNKTLLFALDESLESARRLWEGVQLFATIGRLDYHGNGHELANRIQGAIIAGGEGSLLSSILSDRRQQQLNAVFAPTVPVKFQAAEMLDKELGNRGSIQVLASGDDLGLAPLSYYACEIVRSAAAIFHLMNPGRTRGVEHNARSSFLAGFARGWETPVLMVAESEYESPLDYRDLLFNYSTAAQMVRHVDDWLESIPLKQGSSRRLGRLTMDLELPVSSFGQYVAENEEFSRLEEYFLPTSEFGSLLRGSETVFIGRKGTGKTATMLQAAAELEKDRRNLVVRVKPTSYELAGLVDLVSRFELRSGSEYLLNNLWNFLLSTEVACHLLASADASGAGVGGSPELLAIDRRLAAMRVDATADLATRLEEAISRIQTESASTCDDRELREVVGSALGVHSFKEFHHELRKAAFSAHNRIAILVDNLDKTWESDTDFEVTSRFLLALLGAAGQFRKALLRGMDGRTVTLGIFIRSDIFEVMTSYAREPDKIGPLAVHWDDPYLLARVLEERYSTNRRRKNPRDDDMWATIFPDEVSGLPAKDYILWRILPRPRDIIYFGNAALTTAINRRHAVITQDDIAMADETYSRFAYDALVVESGSQGFSLEDVLYEFAGLNSILTEEELGQVLGSIDYDPLEIRSWLLRTSFLGIEVREGKFAHVEGKSEVDRKLKVASRSSERSSRPIHFRVHPAFRHYLDIRDDDLHASGLEDVTLKFDSE